MRYRILRIWAFRRLRRRGRRAASVGGKYDLIRDGVAYLCTLYIYYIYVE